jgi:hypothetical protein
MSFLTQSLKKSNKEVGTGFNVERPPIGVVFLDPKVIHIRLVLLIFMWYSFRWKVAIY